MSTTTNLSSLVINYLTQAQYDAAAQAGTLNENQIYLTPAVELATVATSGSYNDLSNKPTIPNVPSWALQSSKPSYSLSEISGTDDLQSIEGLSGTSGLLKKTAANTWTLDTNTYLTSYTETDPVFSASAAAGITSADISNWNAKVSDDKTWNGVSLNKTGATFQWMHGEYFIPIAESAASSTMYYIKATYTPTADLISKYDSNKYLYSTTPSANDNSTKVATTAYVDAAIPDVSGFITTDTNTTYALSGTLSSHKFTSTLTAGGSGSGTSTSDFTLAAGTGITITDDTSNRKMTIACSVTNTDEKVKQTPLNGENTTKNILLSYSYSTSGTNSTTNQVYTATYMRYNDYDTSLTLYNRTDNTKSSKLYSQGLLIDTGDYGITISAINQTATHSVNFPDKTGTVALTSDIPSVYNSSTNPNGYLTMATLPIYDGTVV